MRRLKTLAVGMLTITALSVAAGGCVTATVFFMRAMEQGVRPNAALIAFGITIIAASLLFLAARALSNDDED